MRIVRCFFIILFITMLALPLIFVDLSKDRISFQESRMLAKFPDMNDLKHHQGQFIRDFDKWFKDRTGFRNQLLELYNVMGMNKWMDSVMYKEGDFVYLIGENGHHFFVREDDFPGNEILSDEQLANMANKLEKIKVYLDKKGIPFVVMFCADKESIYSEYYPKSIMRKQTFNQLDAVTNYIKEHTSVDVFNIRQALIAEKDNYLIYPVSSGDLQHYTEIGAFFAYRELMKHINIYFPDIVPFDLNDIVISYDKKYKRILEPDVTLKKELYNKLDMSFFDGINVRLKFPWDYVAYENIDANLPEILVFRDSYCGYFIEGYEKKFLTQFIAANFGKAIFTHNMNLGHFEEYVDKYKPDIIVFESVVPKDFASNIADIPELP